MMDPVAPRAVPVGTTRFKILDSTSRRMRGQSWHLMAKFELIAKRVKTVECVVCVFSAGDLPAVIR